MIESQWNCVRIYANEIIKNYLCSIKYSIKASKIWLNFFRLEVNLNLCDLEMFSF